jgi:hypothetical protein
VINLAEVNQALAKTESDIKKFTDKHNAYLKELMSVVQTILPFVFGKMLAGVDKKHIITFSAFF